MYLAHYTVKFKMNKWNPLPYLCMRWHFVLFKREATIPLVIYPNYQNFIRPMATTADFASTAETEANSLENAESEEKWLKPQFNKFSKFEQALVMSAIHAAKYDFSSALNEASQAVIADSSSVAARLQRAAILMRNATSQTVTEKEAKSQINLAIADLRVAKEKSPQNSYIYYNLGCIYLNQKTYNPALEAFNKAIEYDSRLPEAYYKPWLNISSSKR